MKLKYQFVVREVGGTAMAVTVGRDSDRYNGLIKLNAVARTIFEALKSDVTEEEIVALLLSKYEVSEEDAARAVGGFVAKLRAEDLIED